MSNKNKNLFCIGGHCKNFVIYEINKNKNDVE
jgi:hypothetical protein